MRDQEQDNNSIQAETDSLSDSAIRRSLLGCADPVEQEKFEKLLLQDDQFERRVHRLELELADDFSFGQLSTKEQDLFTSRFLVTSDRVRGLAVSKALRKAISSSHASQATQSRQSWPSKFFNLFTFGRPFASAALAATTLLIVGALLWLSLKAPPVRSPVASKQQPAPTPSERQYAHPVASQSPNDKSEDGSTTQPEVLTFTLQPESKSVHKQTVRLANPNAVVSIRLELLLDGASASATYQAGLVSADGSRVTSFSELKVQPGNEPKIVIDVPTLLLKSGSYAIELRQTSADGGNEFDRYSFEVKQE
jgi:hypothetical protein